MPENISQPNVLAHWHYEDDLWRDFLEHESAIYEGSVRTAKRFLLAVLIFTLVGMFLAFFITLLVTKEWYFEMLGPTIFVGFLGWFPIVIAGILWLYRRDKFNRMHERTGEVVISLDGVNANGVRFNWGFGQYDRRFDKVERKNVSINSGRAFEILEFCKVGYGDFGEGSVQTILHTTFEFRIPIPFGKEGEAESIISRLRTQLLTANQEWINANYAFGHSFSQDVCRMCGETVGEGAYRNDKCRG